MKKALSKILIVIGIIIILYPKTMEIYNDYQQKQLIKEWQDSISNIDQKKEEELSIDEDINIKESKNSNYNKNNKPKVELTHEDIQAEVIELKSKSIKEKWERKQLEEKRREEARKKRQEYIKNNMEGILKIDKIDLKLPILSDATKNNLDISISSINHTGKPGTIGNYAIAGHRSRTYGRNFNRLGEVEIGDVIEVVTKDNTYLYKINEIFLVKAEEIWVLRGNEVDKEITLITCHPMINPTHRLIVKGKMGK